jgi:DNA polymerase-3 subunit alpha
VELQRHGIPEQDRVNAVLVQWARKYNVPIIASNDSHYTSISEDSNAHDILLCINTGEKQSTPIASDEDDEVSHQGQALRLSTTTSSSSRPRPRWPDLPRSAGSLGQHQPDRGQGGALKLKKDILLPNYELPEGFTNQDEYLKHLTYEGASSATSTMGSRASIRMDLKIKERWTSSSS